MSKDQHEQYKEGLKQIIQACRLDCCPGCGITLEALEDFEAQAHEAGKEEVVEVIKTAEGHTNEGDAVVDSILQALNQQ